MNTGTMMMHSDYQPHLDTIRHRLHTSVLGDVLDTLGLTRQFLPPHIRAMNQDHVLVGRAMTVLEADAATDAVSHTGMKESFGLMFRALDGLQPGEIYVCTGASPRYAVWGELMSARAASLGAAGAVLDGFHRDTRGIRKLDFPVFSSGSYAQDQRLRGRVIDYRCPIEFSNGVRVNDGDILVGDIDGVVTIPADRLQEVVELALQKVEGEERVRTMIEGGAATQDIFDKTGIM
jgi:regulator of RNase E activity RraA